MDSEFKMLKKKKGGGGGCFQKPLVIDALLTDYPMLFLRSGNLGFPCT